MPSRKHALKKPARSSKKPSRRANKAEVLSSKTVYKGPAFSVSSDRVREPNGVVARRDVVRHSGSAVILAVDDSRPDPRILLERQYRYAADAYLWELPAGRVDPGEKPLAGAKRELLEETGFKAKRWRKMVRYFASPGFLGEFMQVFIAEGLTLGEAQPEYDEQIEIEMVPLSRLITMIEEGKIHDGKTLISVMLYARLRSAAKEKSTK
jgi:ADP-ribose pyrophosphatase